MSPYAFVIAVTMLHVAEKAIFLLVLVMALAQLSRRASASFRHFLWTLGLASVLCMPLLSWYLPRLRVPVPAPVTHVRTTTVVPSPLPDTKRAAQVQPLKVQAPVAGHLGSVSHTGSSAVSQDASTAAPGVMIRFQPAPIPPLSPFAWNYWLLPVWACGTIMVLMRLVLGLNTVRRVRLASVPVTVGSAADVTRAAAQALGVRQQVALRQASSPGLVTVPLTFGVLKPVIVLPADSPGWPEERLRAVLLHEMAHIRRCDWLLQAMAHLACALYWFLPFAWYAANRMRAEAEAACDDRVLVAGVPAPDYARHLLDIALVVRNSKRIAWGTVAMAQSPMMEGRLRAVLAPGISRSTVTIRSAGALAACAVLLAVPTGALQLIPRPQPVPEAARLQLQDDFTLRYAATETDLRSRQILFGEYSKMREFDRKMQATVPGYKPVLKETRMPFEYYLSQRPRTRHILITLSAHDGHLLYRTEEGTKTYTRVYDGPDPLPNVDYYTVSRDPGPPFGPEFTLPAVGLPHVPIFRHATLVNSLGDQQTWMAEVTSPYPSLAAVDVAKDAGTYKLLDIDSGEQRLQFDRHQWFGGLWIASNMTLSRYNVNRESMPSLNPSPLAVMQWLEAHRTPTWKIEYRLLSASEQALPHSGI